MMGSAEMSYGRTRPPRERCRNGSAVALVVGNLMTLEMVQARWPDAPGWTNSPAVISNRHVITGTEWWVINIITPQDWQKIQVSIRKAPQTFFLIVL